MLAVSGYPRKPHPADDSAQAEPMLKRQTKLPVASSVSTRLFKDNLKKLMQTDRELNSQPKVAAESKVGQTSIGRILRGEQSPTLDVVDKLARAFGLEAWQMLVPDLDPTNPPITAEADERQRELWKKLKELANAQLR
jgi:transcriptional regulator with XRE-family HTH domain